MKAGPDAHLYQSGGWLELDSRHRRQTKSAPPPSPPIAAGNPTVANGASTMAPRPKKTMNHSGMIQSAVMMIRRRHFASMIFHLPAS